MIVEVINEFGRLEQVIVDAVETLEEVSAAQDGRAVSAVRIGLRSGRYVTAQHDTFKTLRERLTAAKGGMPIHVQPHSVQRFAEIGELRPLDPTGYIAPPAEPELPPNGQIVVPGVNAAEPYPGVPTYNGTAVGERSTDGAFLWTGAEWVFDANVVLQPPPPTPTKPSTSRHAKPKPQDG